MSIADAFLAEFEHEAETTRKFLERVPADKLNWRPHEKSMTAGQLALHIATAPAGVAEMAVKDEQTAPDFNRPMPQPTSVDEILKAHEESVAKVRRILPTFDDVRMQKTWSATVNGQPVMSLPRATFLRSILLNHLYHHRGQLGVYLRLLGAKVPSSYGPSADELPDFLQKA